MTRLSQLQARLQADIMKRGSGSLDDIRVPGQTDKASRLAVYQNAYKLRLIEILGNDHEALWTHMGDKAFYTMADRYFDACPSNHPNARFVGERLPDFLDSDQNYSANPVLADIARLENAIEWAFDCRDTPMATMGDLTSLPPDRIAGLRMTFSGHVRLVSTRTNAVDMLKPLKAGETPPAVEHSPVPRKILVWRHELVTRYREPEAEETMLAEQAMAGKPFATLCEMAAVMDDAEGAPGRVAGYLTNWINSEMISGFQL